MLRRAAERTPFSKIADSASNEPRCPIAEAKLREHARQQGSDVAIDYGVGNSVRLGKMVCGEGRRDQRLIVRKRLGCGWQAVDDRTAARSWLGAATR
jgi:hypothetical protein